jgi:hypothetical protein
MVMLAPTPILLFVLSCAAGRTGASHHAYPFFEMESHETPPPLSPLASNRDPPDLYFPSSWDYRRESQHTQAKLQSPTAPRASTGRGGLSFPVHCHLRHTEDFPKETGTRHEEALACNPYFRAPFTAQVKSQRLFVMSYECG